MELITLATTALTLAAPFLKKTGEKFSEKIGEDLWDLIKKPFTSDTDKLLVAEATTQKQEEELKAEIVKKLSENPDYLFQLKTAVENAQQQMNGCFQQNITNQTTVEKQVNISNNSGDLHF
jgi:hypothetical protein